MGDIGPERKKTIWQSQDILFELDLTTYLALSYIVFFQSKMPNLTYSSLFSSPWLWYAI